MTERAGTEIETGTERDRELRGQGLGETGTGRDRDWGWKHLKPAPPRQHMSKVVFTVCTPTTNPNLSLQ